MKVGRPSKYKDKSPLFLKHLESQTRSKSCMLTGIHYSTFLEWLEKYPEFSESVKKAEIVFERKRYDNATSAIQKAMPEQWQAAAWWLERKYPEQFARRDNISLTLTDEESEALRKRAIELMKQKGA